MLNEKTKILQIEIKNQNNIPNPKYHNDKQINQNSQWNCPECRACIDMAQYVLSAVLDADYEDAWHFSEWGAIFEIIGKNFEKSRFCPNFEFNFEYEGVATG